jgi:hypothetical protein
MTKEEKLSMKNILDLHKMKKIIVQLNHPGRQKSFRMGDGYSIQNEKIYRLWNSSIIHFRKFIINDGFFVNDVSDKEPQKSDLYFWGEWEGRSYFEPIKNSDYNILPNGLHRPFHSAPENLKQNTDPYIFGEYFKYAFCKQTGALNNLSEDSLILFGSTYPSLGKFYIDTVFVVKTYESAIDVCANSAANYTRTYKEQTLDRLGKEYRGRNPSSNKKLYHGKTWYDNSEYFSFVPCKLRQELNGFERFYLELKNPIFQLSKNPTGKSFLKNCAHSPEELWKQIVVEAVKQGFVLGINFSEPTAIEPNPQTTN